MEPITFAIITVSDSCYKNEKIDESGPCLVQLIKHAFENSKVNSQTCVPDEIPSIKQGILDLCEQKYDVIFTTGGTGFTPRDVTPEATRDVIQKEAPGVITAMLIEGLQKTQLAMLSRGVCGIRDSTLIINFSGSKKAVTEQFSAIKSVITHAVTLIKDNKMKIQQTHIEIGSETRIKEKINGNTFIPSKVKTNFVATRNRLSSYTMISVDEAHDLIRSVCTPTLDTEMVNIENAIGRVIAEDVSSFDALPPFPSSIKDGYAVIASDGDGKRKVIDAVAAGDAPANAKLKPGFCVRISTGAPVPPGADAVVQVEDTEVSLASDDNTKELEINIKIKPKTSQEIRKIGSDIPTNTIVISKNTLLNAAEVGVLAAVGKGRVLVYRRPKIAVISTGNELQNPSEQLKRGHIRDTNKITLISVLKQYGYDSQDFGIAKDEPDTVKYILENAFSSCDMIITTGGVSMGEHDVIKQVLEQDFKAKIQFGRVNMKPGKPTTFATCSYNGAPKIIFGLPGNPVSACVTALLFVIPGIKRMEYRKDILYPIIEVEVDDSVKLDPERPEYHRVQLKFEGNSIRAISTGNQISSRLNSFVGANGLLILPAQSSVITSEVTSSKNKYLCYVIDKFL